VSVSLDVFFRVRLGGRPAFSAGVRTVLDVTEDALILPTDLAEPVHVDRVADDGRVVQSLVEPVNDGAFGRVEDRVDRVDDRVSDVDELHLDLLGVADGHRAARLHLHEVVVDLELPLVGDLLFDQLDRVRGADDGASYRCASFGMPAMWSR